MGKARSSLLDWNLVSDSSLKVGFSLAFKCKRRVEVTDNVTNTLAYFGTGFITGSKKFSVED
jgi:hypothetical protein